MFSRSDYVAGYSVDSLSWASGARPRLPASFSSFKCATACALQLRFRLSSRQYAKRIPPAARIGTAIHEVLESISVIRAEHSDHRSFCLALVSAFEDRVAEQRDLMLRDVRSARFRWPDERVSVIKQRLIEFGRSWFHDCSGGIQVASQPGPREFEASLTTTDGRLTGTIDRVDASARGPVLIDYKSTLASTEESATAAFDQLSFYAYLWRQCRGSWPSALQVVFVSTGESVTEQLDKSRSLDLGHAVESFASSIAEINDRAASSIATVGEACGYCSYKPWCKPYWDAAPAIQSGSFAGAVHGISRGVGATLLTLEGASGAADVRFQDDEFPHLSDVEVGTCLRIVGGEMQGSGSSASLTLRHFSEAFILDK